MSGRQGHATIDTRALFQMVLSARGCRHEWSKDVDPQQRLIVCNKCGLYAYVPKLEGVGMRLHKQTKDFSMARADGWNSA